MFFSVCFVWAYTSPTPTTWPSLSVAVVPETHTWLPTRTAREYPTTGSQGVPLEISCRIVSCHRIDNDVDGELGVVLAQEALVPPIVIPLAAVILVAVEHGEAIRSFDALEVVVDDCFPPSVELV